MIKAAKSVAMGVVALCAGPLLICGSANAQYYDYGPGPAYGPPPVYGPPPAYGPGPGGPVYGAPPPMAPMPPMGGSPGRGMRLSQYEVHNLVRGLGYRRVSEPVLSGRHYMVTALDEGAPVAIRVDAYSGRVVDVQPLIYGRATPEGYYPPEAPFPGGDARAPRPSAPSSVPLPPARPFAREDAPVRGPDGPYPSAQGPANEASPAGEEHSPAPQVVAPAEESAPPLIVQQPAPERQTPAPQASAPASPVAQTGPGGAAPVPSVTATPAAPPPVAAKPVPDVGAGVSTPGAASAGTASVLSSPAASQ